MIDGRTADGAIALAGEGPLYEQIRRAILQLIVSGQWKPGTKVPSEHDLMAQFGASRMTVHRALSALAKEGLIVRRRRAGTVVAEPPAEHAVLAIPSIPDEIQALGRPHRVALLSRRAGALGKTAAALYGVDAGETVLRLEALHWAGDVPHVLEQRVIRLDAVPAAATADFAATAPGTWLLENTPWSQARHVISAVAADAATAQLLEIAVASPCLLVERRTWHRGTHLTTARLTYPGDRHHLVGTFGPYDRARVRD